MTYVGIDVAKLYYFDAAISSDGEELIMPFKFPNDADGFQLRSSHLDSFPDDSFIIGLESTAHYGDNLVRYLVNNGHKVCVINPIQTSTLRKNNIRKTKTDKIDTYIIAKALMLQHSRRLELLMICDHIHPRHWLCQWQNDPWRDRRHPPVLWV